MFGEMGGEVGMDYLEASIARDSTTLATKHASRTLLLARPINSSFSEAWPLTKN
jgi:hypothetical protein